MSSADTWYWDVGDNLDFQNNRRSIGPVNNTCRHVVDTMVAISMGPQV